MVITATENKWGQYLFLWMPGNILLEDRHCKVPPLWVLYISLLLYVCLRFFFSPHGMHEFNLCKGSTFLLRPSMVTLADVCIWVGDGEPSLRWSPWWLHSISVVPFIISGSFLMHQCSAEVSAELLCRSQSIVSAPLLPNVWFYPHWDSVLQGAAPLPLLCSLALRKTEGSYYTAPSFTDWKLSLRYQVGHLLSPCPLPLSYGSFFCIDPQQAMFWRITSLSQAMFGYVAPLH